MREKKSILQNIDKLTLWSYFALLLMGFLTVFAVSYNPETSRLFNLGQTHGRQLVWMFISVFLGFILLTFDSNFFPKFAVIIYASMILLLFVTLALAREINGARSWLQIGSIQFQPAEFAKTATALMLAKYISAIPPAARKLKDKLIAYLIIFLPMAIIVLQQDTGSALVYTTFVLVLYREGFKVGEVLVVFLFGLCFLFSLFIPHQTLLIILGGGILIYVISSSTKFVRKFKFNGYVFLIFFIASVLILFFSTQYASLKLIGAAISIACLFAAWWMVRRLNHSGVWMPIFVYLLLTGFVAYGTDYIMDDVLEHHQSQRVLTLLGLSDDRDANYNVDQSKIAIGSGGFLGKGYLNGTLTQLKHVPEQSTDFIFCTIGEEFGFLGTTIFLLIYLVFILRIIYIAERQRSPFSRIYAYCVAAIFFLQIMINVGMTIGLIPVIGIPLPFISYGGSSVLAFSVMVFILLRLDADRLLILR
ncbi:MAG: rod shape-determining protein RodA [Fimbriimonadaceae bacterium]|nr:rod shape-determining protein RodA [Chitinophagales bacterium]